MTDTNPPKHYAQHHLLQHRHGDLVRLLVGLLVRDLSGPGVPALAAAWTPPVRRALTVLVQGWGRPDTRGWSDNARNALSVANAALFDERVPNGFFEGWLASNLAALLWRGEPFSLAEGFITRTDWRNALIAEILTLTPQQMPELGGVLQSILAGVQDPDGGDPGCGGLAV